MNLWIEDASILACSSSGDDHETRANHSHQSTNIVKRFLDTNVCRHQMANMIQKYNMQDNGDFQMIWS